ncbi:MAG: energy transducer TonB [Acidimicrobiales bacterium]|nr:TonB family protein [Hyphomonadaceae bacterium]RZV40952.1 MAG: energy transducer TonB [Acidimicrobiales bacterium]
MQDAELDMSEDIGEPDTDSENNPSMRKPFMVAPFIGLLFLALALWLVFQNIGADSSGENVGPSEAFLNYQDLSNEMHTGIRLARLEDFLAQYGGSSYVISARARQQALKVHEEKSWAKLTDAYYDPDADDDIKAVAIKAYTDIWTPLQRPEQLKSLTQVLPKDAIVGLNTKPRRSRFASGGNDRFLEGAPMDRYPRPTQHPTMRGDAPERIAASRTVVPRIRGNARKPSYPRKAKRRRVEADVVLALDIDDRGRVARAHLVSVNARRYEDDFVKAAKNAARRTRYHPKTVNGRAVSTSGFVQKYAFRNSR